MARKRDGREERETRPLRGPTAGAGAAMLAALLGSACSRSNNLLLGEVRADVGGHRVTVTDCYRWRAPGAELAPDGSYRYAPCRDAVLSLRGDTLTVNGRGYGPLPAGAAVLVDHGVVSVR